MKFKIFFCQFPNPWALRVSGMDGYTSKCEKSQNHCTLFFCTVLCKKSRKQNDFIIPQRTLSVWQMKKGEGRTGSHAVANTYACMCSIYSLLRSMSDVSMHVDMHPPPPPPLTILPHSASHTYPPSDDCKLYSTVLVSLSFSVFNLALFRYYLLSKIWVLPSLRMRSILRTLYSTIR